MGKIFLALLIILALIIAMPVSLASALNMEGTYFAYYHDGDGLIEREKTAEQAKNDKDAYAVMFVTSAENFEKIAHILGFEQSFSQVLDGETIFYGYSNKVLGGLRLNGRLVNIQMAIKNDMLYIGSPLIVGWY